MIENFYAVVSPTAIRLYVEWHDAKADAEARASLCGPVRVYTRAGLSTKSYELMAEVNNQGVWTLIDRKD